MKKVLSSALLVLVFAAYAIGKGMNGGNTVVAINPNSLQSSSSSPDQTVLQIPSSSSSSEPPTPSSFPDYTYQGQASSSSSAPITTQQTSSAPPPPPPPARSSSSSSSSKQSGLYKDGTYTGVSADAYYGNIQVQVTVSGGKISDVQFLDYPQDRGTSIMINQQAMPYLRQEAIQAQSAPVDIVSGATDSSGAFNQSLASALAQAKNS